MADELTKELQTHLLKMFKWFHEFCETHGLRYYALGGTMLGAARHKGFIPWDDDIDIGILYEDKEKAYELLKNLPSPYNWIDRKTDPNYPRLYGKVLKDHVGLIDVFIIVKTSDKPSERKKQWIARKVLFKLYKGKLGYHNHNETKSFKEVLKVGAARFISFFFSKKSIEKAIDENEKRFIGTDGEYHLNLYSAYSLEKELIRSEWLSPQGYQQFEEGSFPTVNNVDAYLTHLYGDYMKIPDVKDRVLRHEELF